MCESITKSYDGQDSTKIFLLLSRLEKKQPELSSFGSLRLFEFRDFLSARSETRLSGSISSKVLLSMKAARRGFSILGSAGCRLLFRSTFGWESDLGSLALIMLEVSFFDLTEKVFGDRRKIPELSYSFRSSHEGILDSLNEFQHIVVSKCYEISSKFNLVKLSSCLIQHRRPLFGVGL